MIVARIVARDRNIVEGDVITGVVCWGAANVQEWCDRLPDARIAVAEVIEHDAAARRVEDGVVIPPGIAVSVDATSATGEEGRAEVRAGPRIDVVERTRGAGGSIWRQVLDQREGDIAAGGRPDERAPKERRAIGEHEVCKLLGLRLSVLSQPDLVI